MSSERDPLDVEQRYQELMLSLSLPGTPVQRLGVIASFLMFLDDAAPEYESHVIDVAERFPLCLQDLRAYGHHPDRLELIGTSIAAGFRRVPACLDAIGVAEGLRRLMLTCAAAHAYVGDWEGMARVLSGPRPEEHVMSSLVPGDRGVAMLEDLSAGAERDWRDQLAGVRHIFAGEAHEASCEAWFPVVEMPAGTDAAQAGALRHTGATILGRATGAQDSIATDVPVLGVGHMGNGIADVPMRAARSWLKHRRPLSDDHPILGQVSFGSGHALHEGTSSDLAIGVVLASALLRHRNERVQYRIRPGAAFTGELDADGAVRAVDDATLAMKVEAVFCSPCRVLVVPRSQAEEAESCVGALRARHPSRTLDVVGVRSLDDIFYDLRIITEERASLPVHVARTLWRRRSRSVALASTTILLALGGWYAAGRMDIQPTRLEYQGDRLLALNRYGAAVADIRVGELTAHQWERNVSDWDPIHGSLLADVDGDGTKDIIYVQSYGGVAAQEDEVVAWSVKEDRQLWATPVHPVFSFPERSDLTGGSFHLNDVVAADVDGNGSADVYAAASHTPSFPGVVLRIDGRTGTVRQTYVNTGHIADVVVTDMDADGRQELLMCGTNNAFNLAFVAAIDARAIDGCSPNTPAYRCTSPPTGRERVYALLPRSVLGKTVGADAKGNGGLLVRVENARGDITATVNDNKGAMETPMKLDPILNYTFDREMHPLGVATGDSFDQLAGWAVQQRLLPAIPPPSYFEGLRKEIRLWRHGKEVDPFTGAPR